MFERGVSAISDRLRRIPVCRGIRARTGQLSRPAGDGLVDGAVAVAADGAGGDRDDGLGVSGEAYGLTAPALLANHALAKLLSCIRCISLNPSGSKR